MKTIDNMLKYLSIKSVIESPNILINIANKKKRVLLLIVLAIINIIKLRLNAPALMVNILKGIGVKPALNIIIKSYLSYNNLILLNASLSNPGIYSKNNKAK